MLGMALPKGWCSVGEPIESGQAVVFKAQRHGDDATYALKRLKNPKRKERFCREVQVMLAISDYCPIPPILFHDLSTERPFFAMPWYSNGSFEQAIDGRLYVNDLSGGIARLISIAQALSTLHQLGYAHRDVKPSNILLDDNHILLADFGLALSVTDDDGRLTATSEAVGSRLYIAPENASGINDAVDQRPADFYAFGKMVWATLVGKPPFAREEQTKHEYHLATLTGEHRLKGLDFLCAALLKPDPAARLADWSLVLRDMASTLDALKGRTPANSSSQGRLAEIARLVLETKTIKTSIAAEKSERLRKERVSAGFASLHAGARKLETEIASVAKASNDRVSLLLGSGDFGLQTCSWMLPRDILQRLPPNLESKDWAGSAVVLFSKSQPGLTSHELYVNVHLATAADCFWAMRTVCLRPLTENPYAVLFRYSAISGPLEMQRAESLHSLERFGEEASSTFVNLALRWLEIVVTEGDLTTMID